MFYQVILFLLEILDSLSSDYDYLHFLNYGAVQFGRYLPFTVPLEHPQSPSGQYDVTS